MRAHAREFLAGERGLRAAQVFPLAFHLRPERLHAERLDELIHVHTRAEELKNARFDLVTARAVAALPKLITWCAPLVKPGGHFVAMKGAELEDDEGTAAKFGLTQLGHLELTLPDSEGSRRNLVIWVK